MSIFKGSFILTIAKLTSQILAFAGLAYFSRVLGAAELGVFFLFQAVVGVLSMPADFGIGGAVEKRLSEGEKKDEFLAAGLIIKSTLFIIVSVVILAFSQYITSYVGINSITYIVIAIFLSGSTNLIINVLNGELRVDETGWLHFGRQGLYVVIGSGLVTVFPSPRTLIISWILALSIASLFGAFKINTEMKKPGVRSINSLVSYAKYNFVSSSASAFVYNWADVLLIGFFLTQTDVGAYEVAWRVTAFTMILTNSIGTSVFPRISQLYERGEESQISQVLKGVTLPSIALVVPVFFGSIVTGDLLLSKVFGEEFRIASVALSVLLIEKVFRGLHVIYGHSLKAIKHPEQSAKIAALATFLNILLNILLIPRLGLEGAAIATTVAATSETLLSIYILNKYITVELPIFKIGWCIISSIVMMVLVYLIRITFEITTLVGLGSLIGIGGGVYILLLLVPRRIRKDFQKIRSSIVSG